MKIITKGHTKKNFIGNWTCNTCHCRWRMDPADEYTVKFVPDNRDGDYYEMPCPDCKAHCTRVMNAGQGGQLDR